MKAITGLFQNNLRNVAEVSSVTLPAELEGANYRMGTDPIFAAAGEVYQALVIPPRSIMKKFYLVVEDGMTGLATVTLANGGDALFTDVDISVPGIFVSTIEDLFTDTPEGFDIVLSATQVPAANGQLKVLCDFSSIDTNNGIYGG